MLKTMLCRQLGIEYPLFSAGMGGGMAGPELVAAVSNAGACGVLGMGGLPAPYIRQQIQQTRTLTNKPFGVNILLPFSKRDRSKPVSRNRCLSWCSSGVTLSRMSGRPAAAGPRYLSR
jgi:nitronate monooxygenase